ncbi:MAG: DUF2752 domain-containing protein [Phycisphaerae bacterium]|nr:DUF2752 domain-containing protein [Phycisphaerae bacterium]MDW8263004.1 DUF2752 domain-containing protein [Phycisphaerales bacterium]
MSQPIATRIHRLEPLRLSFRGRVLCALLSVACLGVLVTARLIEPSPSGVGTHRRLGMAPCSFLRTTGLPCGTCGMTTAVAHFSRGNLATSFYVQPFGAAVAVATGMAFWVAGYCAVSGRPAYRLLRRLPVGGVVTAILAFWLAAWGWKIWLVVGGRVGA